jgi:N utilization substance protein A
VNALSPTNVSRVELDEANKKAKVLVPDDQLSIAIGKSGQNVRLASKLTGYELDIEADKGEQAQSGKVETTELPKQPKLKKKSELENSLLEAIEEHGD